MNSGKNNEFTRDMSEEEFQKVFRKKHFLKRKQTALSTDVVKKSRELEAITLELINVWDKRTGRKNWETVPYGTKRFYDALIEDSRDTRMNILCGYTIPKTDPAAKGFHYSLAVTALNNFEADLYLLYKYGNAKIKDEEFSRIAILVDSVYDMTQRLAYSSARDAEAIVLKAPQENKTEDGSENVNDHGEDS